MGISGEILDDQPILPKRVLDITSPESVRLFETLGRKAPYAALSHCWGGQATVVTTKDNLGQHLERLDVTSLSKTFREAIMVANRLGLQYLWIDALCIIQRGDDMEDWREQSGVMGKIYEDASLVIAATAARNGNEGCFVARPELDAVSMLCVPGDESQGRFYFSMPDKHRFEEIESGPLNQRGWVLQEYRLSRRKIHFALGQTHWECARSFIAEDGSTVEQHQTALITPLHVLLKNPRHDYSFLLGWWGQLMKRYCTHGFTRQSDKLHALRGISNRILESEPLLEYYHGHWRTPLHQMEHGLAWYARENTTLTRPQQQRAPSWSWASVDGPIEFLQWHYAPADITEIDMVIERLENMPRHGIDPYYVLSVTCIIERVSRSESRVRDWLGTHQRTFYVLGRRDTHLGWVTFDCDDERPVDFFVAPVARPSDSVSETRARLFLALLSTDTDTGSQYRTYRRIGAGELTETEWLDDCGWEKVRIE